MKKPTNRKNKIRFDRNIKFISWSEPLIKVSLPKENFDKINHPSHYGGDTPYEVIKVMEEWLTREEFIGAMKFNIHKYLARALKKDNEQENYEKANFYNNYLVDFCKRKS